MVVADRDAVIPAPALLKRVSWGAILAGAVIAIALTALLGLLGIGIGLGTLDIAQGDSLRGAPKATLIWWAVTSIAATGIGAFVAARLAGIPRGITGAFHGLAVWAVATIITLWLATSAIGFALGAATNVVTTTARVASSVATTAGGAVIDAGGAVAPSGQEISSTLREQGVTRQRIQREAQDILSRSGIDQRDRQQAQDAVGSAAQNIAMRPGTAEQEVNRLIDRLFSGPNAVFSPQERDQLITTLSQRAGLSRQEAEQVASRWQLQAQAATQQVRTTGENVVNDVGETAVQVSDDAVDVLSKAAWGMFLISLAGLVAALIGAAIGGATLGLGLLAAGTAAAAHDRDHERYDEDRDLDRDRDVPPPRRR